MDIKRINDNQVRCAITEQEIEEMGFDINSVIANTEETQKFMRKLLEKIEEQEVIDIERLSPMVRAELFPDHTMNIIFGGLTEAEQMHMFDDVIDMMEGFDKLKERLLQKADEPYRDAEKISEAVDHVIGKEVNPFYKEGDETDTYFSDYTVLGLEFDSLDKVIRICKLFEEIPMNELYKMNDMYYLLMDLSFLSKARFRPVAFAATEYNGRPIASEKSLAHIREHGKCMIAEDAIRILTQL